jgi:hypothetical protein
MKQDNITERYGIRLQVNVVPQCRNTLQYVVSYVKFLEDFAQTKYCSSNEKKIIQIFVEYDTLDRIYKFEDKQKQTGMTLGHKCFVTQFSTKEVLRNETIPFRVLVISYRWTVLSYFVPTKTRPTYICTRCSRAIWAFGG